MKIAMIAPPYENTPPERYGGTERVVSVLTEELMRRGHEVTLFATKGSKTSAKLVGYFDVFHKGYPLEIEIAHLIQSLQHINKDGFDIIHNHCNNGSFLGDLTPIPVVTTIHSSIYRPSQDMPHFFESFPNASYVAISDRQAEMTRALKVNITERIYHGIETEKIGYSHAPGQYLAFIGHLRAEKGPHHAIEAAKRTGLPLKIAGKIDHRTSYFKEEIAPHLYGGLIDFVGELNDSEKIDFLKQAIACLCPIDWDEPFGLVFVEAMACGTPVIAFNRGSVPEIIVDGKTGFIVSNVHEMIERIRSIGEIDRAYCRQYVLDHFDVGMMVDQYEKTYEGLINRKKSTGRSAV